MRFPCSGEWMLGDDVVNRALEALSDFCTRFSLYVLGNTLGARWSERFFGFLQMWSQ